MTAKEVPNIAISEENIADLREQAREAIKKVDLPGLLQRVSPGVYGLDESHLRLLKAVELGLATTLATLRGVTGRIAADRRNGFAGDELTGTERRFCNLLAVSVGMQEGLAVLDLGSDVLPTEDRHLNLDEYGELFGRCEGLLVDGLVRDLCNYLRFYGEHPDDARRPRGARRLHACLGSYLALVARTAARLGNDGEHAAMNEALRESAFMVAGCEYLGFRRHREELLDENSELLPVAPEDIVGNQQVLEAGLKLSRAVAGFDLAKGVNPRGVHNPVLFVLGAPGCGKTVTAHAIGNSFLKLCDRHGILARFRIIRRTDWASHYQNSSANELLRIFREEIFGFPGVVGAYWPDIDTAFSARDDPQVRPEDKAVLGTLFGLLDGTVGPRNGKWFLIADANYLTMDSALVSRLSQDPYRAQGPQTAQEYISLLRDKKLHCVHQFIDAGPSQWLRFGERCVESGLSGRAIDNIAGKLTAMVDNVNLPEEYFSLSYDEKQKLLGGLRQTVSSDVLEEQLERYISFGKDAEQRARDERFGRRVTEIRERLAAEAVAISGGGR